MKILITIFSSCISFLLIAQSPAKILYFNQFLDTADSSSATIKGWLVQENQRWKLTLRIIATNAVLSQGYYLDPEMQVADGILEFWYENGVKKSEEHYTNGKPHGKWKTWDEVGRLSDTSLYLNGKLIKLARWTFYENDSLKMTQFVDLPNKKTYVKYYYEEGGLRDDVEFFDDKEIERKSYFSNGQLKLDSKKDKKGKQTYIKRFSETGEEISEKEYQKQLQQQQQKIRERFAALIPEFKSGELGFQMYLTQNLKIPQRVIRENMDIDEVKITFSLNQHGRAHNIVVDGVNDPEFMDVITKFFETSPSWDMKGLDKYGPLTYKIKFLH